MDKPKVGEIWLVHGYGKFPTTVSIVEYDDDNATVTTSIIDHWGRHQYYHISSTTIFLDRCIRKLK